MNCHNFSYLLVTFLITSDAFWCQLVNCVPHLLHLTYQHDGAIQSCYPSLNLLILNAFFVSLSILIVL